MSISCSACTGALECFFVAAAVLLGSTGLSNIVPYLTRTSPHSQRCVSASPVQMDSDYDRSTQLAAAVVSPVYIRMVFTCPQHLMLHARGVGITNSRLDVSCNVSCLQRMLVHECVHGSNPCRTTAELGTKWVPECTMLSSVSHPQTSRRVPLAQWPSQSGRTCTQL